MRTFEQLYIGGRWVEPSSRGTLDVVSPHSEEVIGRVPEVAPADVDRAVQSARAAFDEGDWPRMAPEERAAVISAFADAYATHLDELAGVITDEMGSPITFSKLAQAPGAWVAIQKYVEMAKAHPWEEVRAGMTGPVVVRREPSGVVAAVVPWNVPQMAIVTKMVPALLAGCAVVVKPAPETPLDAYLLAEILEEVGLPEGVVSILPAGREVGEHLVAHPGVDKVAFTGSTAAGRRVAALCGEQLKRVSLELGGKSAAIVLDDADLDATMAGLKFVSYMNSGQACVAQTRILASRARYDEVVDAVAAMTATVAVGDPNDPDTHVGPMVAERQQVRVESYIALGQQEGARIVAGGRGRPDGLDSGWYVRPTVFADATNDMRIAREEIFGPVLVVIPYDDERDAVRIANDSEYGLAGSVWTADTDAGLDVARRIRVGSFGVNLYSADFGSPFGGFKASGIGRENGPEGLDEYVELKSIAMAADS